MERFRFLSGRYYAMDRDNNWDRVQKAYDSLTKGEGVQAEDAVKAMEDSYAKGCNRRVRTSYRN